MGKDYLKKVLAGIGMASLVGGIGIAGPAVGASGWSATKSSAVSTEEANKAEPGAMSAEEEKAAAEKKAVEEEKAKEVEKAPGKSGWSGSK